MSNKQEKQEDRDYTIKSEDWNEELVLDDHRALARFYGSFKTPLTGNGCWLWTGKSFDKNGYPRFFYVWNRDDEKRKALYMRACRVAYTIYHDKAPGDQMVLHTCDNPRCVSENHLYLGDHLQNAADRRERTGYATLKRGAEHAFSKITETQAKQIIKLGQKLVSATQINKIMGLDLAACQINQIVSGESWAHLGERKSKTALTQERIAKVLEMHAAGFSKQQIIKKTKYCLGHIDQLILHNGKLPPRTSKTKKQRGQNDIRTS